MSGNEAIWHEVVETLLRSECLISTLSGFRFRAYVDHGSIYLSYDRHKAPSSRLPARKRISKSDFYASYAYFDRWSRGEAGVKADSEHMSRESACVFAIAHHVRRATAGSTGTD